MSDDKKTVFLTGELQRRSARRYIDEAPAGYVMRLMPPAKSRDQEEKYHAMIGDIAKCCTFMGQKLSLEDWKRLLVDAFVRIMREQAKAQDKPDPFAGEGRVMPSLDGSGIVQLGVQTRSFAKAMACEFIEYLYAYGSENNVVWTPAAKAAMHQLRRAA
jgi:hypothetical protein